MSPLAIEISRNAEGWPEALDARAEEAVREALKQSKAQERATKASNAAGSQGNSWNLVVSNIALKNGDFPGTKDISRMRDAIVNKAKDNN